MTRGAFSSFLALGVAALACSVVDTNPPEISSVFPGRNTSEVSIDLVISGSFNKAMDFSSIDSSTFTLSTNGQPVQGTLSFAGTTAFFHPLAKLQLSTTYEAVLTGAVKDREGRPMGTDFVWRFLTAATEPAPSVPVPPAHPSP